MNNLNIELPVADVVVAKDSVSSPEEYMKDLPDSSRSHFSFDIRLNLRSSSSFLAVSC